MLDERDNEIAFLEKLLADTEKSCQSERKASVLYLWLAILGWVLLLAVLALLWIGIS